MPSSWLNDVVERLREFLPPEVTRVVVALAVIVLGYVIARLFRCLAQRVLRRASGGLVRFAHRLFHRAEPDPALELAQEESFAVSFAGNVVFWLVFVLFLGGATTVLGFPLVSTWLAGLAGFLPRLLAAAGTVLLGILAGRVLRVPITTAARSAGLRRSHAIGRTAQNLVILLSVIVAVDELGIEITFLVVVTSIALAAALGSAAIAFGLGSQTAVANLVACHYLSKWYKVGQIIQIGEHRGRITHILSTAVVLQTDAGKVHVPAKSFADTPSLLLSDVGGE